MNDLIDPVPNNPVLSYRSRMSDKPPDQPIRSFHLAPLQTFDIIMGVLVAAMFFAMITYALWIHWH